MMPRSLCGNSFSNFLWLVFKSMVSIGDTHELVE
jgi:hypothetical protein